MQLERGEQIGAFEVEGLLGVGGMAEVWAVRHTLLGSRHALKVFPADSPRIQREAAAMSAITHDNLLPVEALLTVHGRPALLMPLIDGPTLGALSRLRPLDRDEALSIMIGVVKGLCAAHGAGLVHRDLKPDNILIERTARGLIPRIMDFGLVKLADDPQTRAGMALGTPAYAAPEQLRDARQADACADLWSVGVILCELLTGRPPASPPDLSGVPDDLVPILAGLLRVAPAERTSDAASLLAALTPLVTGDPLAADGALAAAIPTRGPAAEPESLWTWGAEAEPEPPPVSPVSAPPEVTGIPWTDRYVLERELGRGGMAVVWRAWDRRLSVWRAIKILQPHLSTTAARRRFEQEAHAMARLSHPGILPIHDIAEHDGQLFIVMPLLPGGSLAERIQRGPLSPQAAAAVLVAVLQALAVAHEAGIVHRDIKPGNILLDDDDRPVITDFGIARIGAEEALTRTGMALGTLSYMAPEQRADARSVDHRADLYAAGGTLWTALTGRAPLLFVAPESRAELLSAVPGPLAEVILTATRYRPEDRYADAVAMAEAVSEAASGAALPEANGESRPAPRAARWLLAVGLALLGVTGLIVGPTLLEPATEPVVEPVTEPVTGPVEPPTTEPLTEPDVEPVTEPVTEPDTAPTRPTAPPPEPVSEPVVEPVTEPVTEPVAQPEPTGWIHVVGDAENIQLIDESGGVYAPGAVRPGTYTLRVWFAERHTSGTASITVGEGQRITMSCTNQFSMCTEREE